MAELYAALETMRFSKALEPARRAEETTSRLLVELEQDSQADPEFIASLQVYRNASVLFRHLAIQDDISSSTGQQSCRGLIEQGADLLDRFLERR
jgi:hypothetical protein